MRNRFVSRVLVATVLCCLVAIGFRAQAQTSAVPPSFATVGKHLEFEGAIVIDTQKRLYLVLDGVLRPAPPSLLEFIRERTNELDGVPTAVIAKWSMGEALPDDLRTATLMPSGKTVIYSKLWYRTVTSNVYHFGFQGTGKLFPGSTDLGDLPAAPLPPSQIADYQRSGFVVAPPTPAAISISLNPTVVVPTSVPITLSPTVKVTPPQVVLTLPSSTTTSVQFCTSTLWPTLTSAMAITGPEATAYSTSQVSYFPVTAILIPVTLSSGPPSADCSFPYPAYQNLPPAFTVSVSGIKVTGESLSTDQQAQFTCTPVTSGTYNLNAVTNSLANLQCTLPSNMYWAVYKKTPGGLGSLLNSSAINSAGTSFDTAGIISPGAPLTVTLDVVGSKTTSAPTHPQHGSFTISVTDASSTIVHRM